MFLFGVGNCDEVYVAVRFCCFAEVEECFFGEGAAAVAEKGEDCGFAGFEGEFGGARGWCSVSEVFKVEACCG